MTMKKLSIFSPSIEKAKDLSFRIKNKCDNITFEIREYSAIEVSQLEFLMAIHNDDAVIVDCTIPTDLKQSSVYPALTAQINMLDHILVYSDEYYEDKDKDGYYVPILPLNITPQRVYRSKNKDVDQWLIEQLLDIQEHSYYPRLNIKDVDSMVQCRLEMEQMLMESKKLHDSKTTDKTRVMISYRNSCSQEVEEFRKKVEAEGKVEIKVLPPGSLCGDYEAHTPMRRWMLVGLLDDQIREVDEVWVYYNEIYTNSWWTIAELIMVANINYDRDENHKIKILVYDANLNRFLSESESPEFVKKISLSPKEHRRLARLLSNTRPDTMGPENLENINQLKQIVPIMRNMPKFMRDRLAKHMRPILEQGVPQSIPKEQQEDMIQDLVKMYSEPDELERYVNDEVFQDAFWNIISYQTEARTSAVVTGRVDPTIFMDAPMSENTGLSEIELAAAVENGEPIVLKSSSGLRKYRVEKGMKRYLWLATRMGKPTVKDAPGLEVIQTYNLMPEE